MLKVYAYAGCGTCRTALAWLKEHDVTHRVIPIREQPPSISELQQVLNAVDGDLGRLFNRSGADYRELGLSPKLKTMSVAEALKLLSTNGNLVKRPFVVMKTGGLVGFNAEVWSATLLSAT